MADGTGLSIGATRLAAVVVDRTAVTRTPVLTLYPYRPPEVGVPSENPDLNERGLIVTDFIDRVGDPVAIVGADGSTHHAEALLTESLRALLRTIVAGRSAGPVAVSHPAHWRAAAVDALRAALAGTTEFRGTDEPLLVADATSAVTALARDPGVPTQGVIAVCDFGGTGTSLTLVDMARGAQAGSLAPTVRHPDLSGDLIDQALLKHVIDGLSEAGAIDLTGTSAIGSLSRLRAQCRTAKEHLSTNAVTSLTADLAGRRTDLRITRDELDGALSAPLQAFADLIQEELERNDVQAGDLAAVASIGGGARIPAVTTLLSERFRVPVITPAHPELTAAIGAGLRSVRATVKEGVTAVALAASTSNEVSSTGQPLAWSDAHDIPDIAPVEPLAYEEPDESAASDVPRPMVQFVPHTDTHDDAGPPWYRRPLVLVGMAIAGALVVLGSVTVLLLRNDSAPRPTTPPATTSAPAPVSRDPVSSEPPPTTQAPPPTTQAPPPRVTEQAPAPPQTQAPQPAPQQPAPPPQTEAPPAAPPVTTEVPPPAPAPTTEAPPPAPTAEQPPPAPIEGPVITIPGLPPIPLFPQPAQPAP
ncbi:molecular chaperone [Mycolicibacterium cyprinidarum]|nr:molecular chaperone [Mycolicibacterium sp. NGTWS1803]